MTVRGEGDQSASANGRVRLGGMGEGRRSPLSLNSLLAAVEAAPPVAAVDVLAAELAESDRCPRGQLPDRGLQWPVADSTGPLGWGGGSAFAGEGDCGAGAVGWDAAGAGVGSPGGRGGPEDGGARVFAPVTSRGEAVGVLELGLEEFPVEQTVADVALAAHFLAYVVIANRGSVRFSV